MYVKINSLIPIDVASGDYVENLIKECNEPIPFLRFHYFIVNTHNIRVEEIDKYLKDLKNEGL